MPRLWIVALACLLAFANFALAESLVADAAMRGDDAEVRRLLGSGAYRTEVGALHAGTTFARNPISAADWPRSAVRSVRGRSGARGRREAQIAAVEPTQMEQLLIGDWKRR